MYRRIWRATRTRSSTSATERSRMTPRSATSEPTLVTVASGRSACAQTGLSCGGLRRRGGRRLRLDQRAAPLVLPNHAELEACTLLHRLEPLLEVADLRIESVVARLQRLVLRLLALQLPLDLPHAEPAALAQPQRILDQHRQHHERDRECAH